VVSPPPYPPGVAINKADCPIFAVSDQVWQSYPQLQGDCSGDLKAVARGLCVLMSTGDANAIVAWLTNQPGWLRLGHDARQAALLAGQGCFVVAG
jgi:hypothetical protein